MLRLTERINFSKVLMAPAATSSSQHFSDSSVATSVTTETKIMPFVSTKLQTYCYAQMRCFKLKAYEDYAICII